MIAFMVVDLPAPLRPISATTSPRPTSSDRSYRICAAPYQALRPATSSIGSLMTRRLRVDVALPVPR